VCEAVHRILAGTATRGGARAPGELFDAKCFLRALAPDHLRIEIEEAVTVSD
jgi:hypothetical protein